MTADLQVRLDEPESIHDMRVAIRRIRSILKTFRPMLVAETALALRPRLRELGVRLGVARDSEVLLERLFGFLDELPQTFVLGPVRRRLQEQLHGEYLRGRSAAIGFMASAAYAELLEDVIASCTADSLTRSEKSPQTRCLRRWSGEAAARSCAGWRRQQPASDGDERDHALHQVRKAAKQARYAAEAVKPAFGRSAARLAKQAKEIQQILGDHQDSVVAAGVLREFGVAAHGRADECAFTSGFWPVWSGLTRPSRGVVSMRSGTSHGSRWVTESPACALGRSSEPWPNLAINLTSPVDLLHNR